MGRRPVDPLAVAMLVCALAQLAVALVMLVWD